MATTLSMSPSRGYSQMVRWNLFLGHAWTVVGWVVTFLAAILCIIIFSTVDLVKWDSIPLVEVSGQITKIEALESGSKKGGRVTPVSEIMHRYSYDYSVNGVSLKGDSYKKGFVHEVGDTVTVLVVADDPSTAKIKGMQAKRFSVGSPGWVFLFVVGLFCFVLGWVFSGKKLLLLTTGGVAHAERVHKERIVIYSKTTTKTGTKTKKRYTFEYRFKFKSADGRDCQAQFQDPKELDAQETLFYDLEDPTTYVFLNLLPGAPLLGASGNIEARKGFPLLFIFPAILVIFAVIIAWVLF